jgi:hypothetical protein
MKKAQPDVEFVSEQAPLGKIDAGAVAQAIDDAKPDAIFNVLFGGDLAKFARRHTRGVFKNRTVVSLLGRAGISRSAQGRGSGRLTVTGYPWDKIKTPAHTASSMPIRRSSTTIRGSAGRRHVTLKSIAAGITKASGHRHREAGDGVPRPESTGRSARSPIGPATTRLPWAPCRQDRARRRQGHHGRLQICRRPSVLPSDAEVKASPDGIELIGYLPRLREGGFMATGWYRSNATPPVSSLYCIHLLKEG